LPELMQQPRVRLLRVADDDQHGVGEQHVERPRAEPAVPGDEAVLADRPLDPQPEPGCGGEHVDDDGPAPGLAVGLEGAHARQRRRRR
jgi:hypothetical protein